MLHNCPKKMKNICKNYTKEVKAMKNIIFEVTWQLKWPNIPNKSSDKRLEQNLTTLGFDGSQIKDIQNSWG